PARGRRRRAACFAPGLGARRGAPPLPRPLIRGPARPKGTARGGSDAAFLGVCPNQRATFRVFPLVANKRGFVGETMARGARTASKWALTALVFIAASGAASPASAEA